MDIEYEIWGEPGEASGGGPSWCRREKEENAPVMLKWIPEKRKKAANVNSKKGWGHERAL